MSKKTNRSAAAKRANQTRKARKEFELKYGSVTYDACDMFSKGYETTDIAFTIFSTTESVAATRANFTRGTYEPFAGPNGGTCNF